MTGQAARTPGAPSTPQGVDGLRALRASGVAHALLDVRELPETDAGHIPGASTVPLRVLALRLEELLPVTTIPVILVDGGGEDRRAAAAAAMLRDAGHTGASVLAGGLQAWIASGARVESGRNVPSKRFGELALADAPEDLLVDPRTAAGWIADGRVDRILDVRTRPEHERECIPGSEHAPGFDVVAAALERHDPDRPLIVHCTGRTRGIIAAMSLRMLGVSNVYALENGTMGWRLAGLELEHGVQRSASTVVDVGDEMAASAARLATSVGVGTVPPAEARERVARQERPTLLFDLRPTEEHAVDAPWRSLSVSSGQLVQQLDDHVVIEGADVLLIDDDPLRPLVAGYWLRRIGVARVDVVEGGVDAWRRAGLPSGPVGDRPVPERIARAVATARGVTPDELEGLTGPGTTVLSIGSSAEHAAGHVPGARWTLAGTVLSAAVGPDRHGTELPAGELVLTCADGMLSAVVADRLRAAGRTDVRVLTGGLAGWRASGREAATGPVVADAPDVIEHPIHVGTDAMEAYLSWELDLEHDQGPL